MERQKKRGTGRAPALARVVDWLDRTLDVAAFDDVSNNGVQIARRDRNAPVSCVAFAVDASVRAVRAAADAGAQLLVVHHGLSWGGGIKRLTGGVYDVVRVALDADLALYACHLPLDAHPTLGNNAGLAKELGLRGLSPAFRYRGQTIGFTGMQGTGRRAVRVGVCSGGAGEFAEEAQRLGCGLFVTGEASWGEVIAAENVGMKMVCLGHYETEVYGVRAVAAAMAKALKVTTRDLTDDLRPRAAEPSEAGARR